MDPAGENARVRTCAPGRRVGRENRTASNRKRAHLKVHREKAADLDAEKEPAGRFQCSYLSRAASQLSIPPARRASI